MNLFLIFVFIAVIAIIAWNVVPSFRERLRGLTTVFEGVLVGVTPIIGTAVDAFQQTNWKEYIPEGSWPYICMGLAAWFILKRVITRTPVGQR